MFEKALIVFLVGFLCALLWMSSGKSAEPTVSAPVLMCDYGPFYGPWESKPCGN